MSVCSKVMKLFSSTSRTKFLVLAIGLPILMVGGVASALIATTNNSSEEEKSVVVETEATTTTTAAPVALPAEDPYPVVLGLSAATQDEYTKCFAGRISKAERFELGSGGFNYFQTLSMEKRNIITDCHNLISLNNSEARNYNPFPPAAPVDVGCVIPYVIGMSFSQARSNVPSCLNLTLNNSTECPEQTEAKIIWQSTYFPIVPNSGLNVQVKCEPPAPEPSPEPAPEPSPPETGTPPITE